MAVKLSLEELAQSARDFFTPGQVSGVCGSDPQTIRITARQRPELLGFPVVCIGNRVKIPKRPFLDAFGYEEREV
nr:MAG TPA: hypothetical protein [Bacteriophage sp.]